MRIRHLMLLVLGLFARSPSAFAQDTWLQVPLSATDRVTLSQAGVPLNIRDAQGNPVAYALCPVLKASPSRQQDVPLTALTRGAELRLRGNGSAHLQTAPGVSLQPPWERWVLDLRPLAQPLIGFRLPARIDPETISLRSSPNLQQWSRPHPFTVAADGNLLFANPLGDDWLAIVFSVEPDFAPKNLTATLAADTPQRDRQWFPVKPDANGIVDAPLPERVRGVQISSANPPLQGIDLASRIKPRDAWKARGQWRPGDGPTVILFNGIGDAQWRLQARPAQAERDWMLAHDRMEIRMESTAALPLTVVAESSRPHLLACDSQRWTAAARTLPMSFAALEAIPTRANSQSTNVLPWFLGLLVILTLLGYAKSRR